MPRPTPRSACRPTSPSPAGAPICRGDDRLQRRPRQQGRGAGHLDDRRRSDHHPARDPQPEARRRPGARRPGGRARPDRRRPPNRPHRSADPRRHRRGRPPKLRLPLCAHRRANKRCAAIRRSPGSTRKWPPAIAPPSPAPTPPQSRLLALTRDRFLGYRDRCPTDSCIATTYRGRMREIDDIMANRWRGRQ